MSGKLTWWVCVELRTGVLTVVVDVPDLDIASRGVGGGGVRGVSEW